jgi:formate dehydrogenase beta subunit
MQAAPVRFFRGADRSGRLKGRAVDDAALNEVRALLGPRPQEGFPRDLLIEYLHRINDRWHGLHERHLAALARELALSMAEVF